VSMTGKTSVVSASLTAFGAQPTEVQVTVVELSPLARFGRSGTGLVGLWGAAAVAIFFPVLHLILVPTLLVGGVVVAVLRARQAQKVASVRGICPRCRTERSFQARGRARRQQIVDCPACHANATLVVDAAPDGGAAPIETAAEPSGSRSQTR
jgi:hypothetical protein